MEQVAQYIVLIIAYLIPVFWMSNKLGYGLIPHFAQFDAVKSARIRSIARCWNFNA